MGMYTEFHFNSRLKPDVPQSVLDVLRFMVDGGDKPETPKHPLFKTARWALMLTCDSYYFDADTHSTLRFDDIAGAWFLCIRCNLENYEDEIEKFCDWIMPYIDRFPGDFLGFSRYEDSEIPCCIFAKPQVSVWSP